MNTKKGAKKQEEDPGDCEKRMAKNGSSPEAERKTTNAGKSINANADDGKHMPKKNALGKDDNLKKKGKITAIEHDAMDDVTLEIQPLPSQYEAQEEERGPGAHAVGGRPSGNNIPYRYRHQGGGHETDEESNDHLIDEAVVVVDSDDDEDNESQHDAGSCVASVGRTSNLAQVLKIEKHPNDGPQQTSSRMPLLVVAALVILVVALLLTFLVILPYQEEDNNPEEALSFPGEGGDESSVLEGYVIPFQDEIKPNYIEDIQVVGSPANLANQWMMADPHLHSYSPERQRQRFTLAALYYTTGGDHWQNSHHWLSYEVSECYWYSTSLVNFGTPVCDEDNRIISVSLSSNNLTGTFPLYFSHLDHLQVFDLADNHVSGVLPALYTSSFLEVFSVSNNDLEGQLIGQGGFAAYGLKVANVDGNRFTGSLIVFQWLQQLEFVNVSDNLFDGGIPPQLEECRNLTYLGVANNLYEGPIPSELGLLSKLQEMDLSGNTLVTGVIPPELANMESLVKLDISDTSVDGAIPQELCAKQQETDLEIVANCSTVQCCD